MIFYLLVYFTGDDGYHSFLVFVLILGSLVLDNNAKVTNWISPRVSPEEIRPFDNKLKNNFSAKPCLF